MAVSHHAFLRSLLDVLVADEAQNPTDHVAFEKIEGRGGGGGGVRGGRGWM